MPHKNILGFNIYTPNMLMAFDKVGCFLLGKNSTIDAKHLSITVDFFFFIIFQYMNAELVFPSKKCIILQIQVQGKVPGW